MNKYLIIFFVLNHIMSFSQERRVTRDANDYFLNQLDSLDVDIAIDKYNQAINYNNDFNIAKFNLANTLYSKGQFENSIDLLEEIISNENNQIKKSKAYYNKGKNEVELFNKSEKKNKEFLESATNSFKQSLRNNPNDDDARFNLEKCLSMLKELEEQDQNKDNQEEQDQNKDNQEEQDQNKDNQEEQDQNKDNQEEQDQNKDNQEEQDQNKDNQEEQDQNKDNQEEQDQNKDNQENNRNSKSGNTDGESEENEKKQIKQSQINQILNAVEQKEKDVKKKVKNVNTVEIKSTIKKTDKDW